MFFILGSVQITLIIFFISILLTRTKKPIIIFSNIIIFATVIAIIKYALINKLFNPGYPNSTFLFNPIDRFNDLYQ
jgi:hypothetical protein